MHQTHTDGIVRDKKGQPKADTKLRDYEKIPLTDDIDAYFEREVLPHVPDAARPQPGQGGQDQLYALLTRTRHRARWRRLRRTFWRWKRRRRLAGGDFGVMQPYPAYKDSGVHLGLKIRPTGLQTQVKRALEFWITCEFSQR